jgi:gamma-glutamyltranspeptidase / glutathione hydrolase
MPYNPTFTTRPEIAGTFGAVSSTHWLATQTAMAMLEKGGNAFDAAVAGGLVLQVVEPHMNGIGGDAVAIIQTADGKAPQVLCGQGVAPAGATVAHYRSEGLSIIPGTGLLAAVVPGAFDAWMLMLRDHGTMTLAEVMAPAIGYARDGFPLVAGAVSTIAGVADLFRAEWQSSANVYLPQGGLPEVGALFANPRLADTYSRLLAEGSRAGADRERQIEAARAAFYKGFVAETIERYALSTPVLDASGLHHKGVLTAADMAAWQASWEAPVTYDYRGLTFCKSNAWGQGPFLLQTLALLKGFDVGAMDAVSADFVHTLVEAMKLAFADRDAYYGDTKFTDVPLKALLSDAYNDERRKLIGETASLEQRPGSPDGRVPRLPRHEYGVRQIATTGTGEPTRVEREQRESYNRDGGAVQLARVRAARGPAEGDTCHIDVVDRHGNAAAVTPSGGWLQSSPVIPELGFPLGTRGQMFWLEEGLPSTLAPGRRPRTTLTPTLALRDGKFYMAFGSPGGDNQDQWIIQFLLRHVDHKLPLQAATDTPQLQSNHMINSFYPRPAAPGRLVMESRFPAETIKELERRGHQVEVSGPWSLGRNCAVTKDGKLMHAAATPRMMQAYAVTR